MATELKRNNEYAFNKIFQCRVVATTFINSKHTFRPRTMDRMLHNTFVTMTDLTTPEDRSEESRDELTGRF